MSTKKEREEAYESAKAEAAESNVPPSSVNLTLDDGYVNGEEGFTFAGGITAETKSAGKKEA